MQPFDTGVAHRVVERLPVSGFERGKTTVTSDLHCRTCVRGHAPDFKPARTFGGEVYRVSVARPAWDYVVRRTMFQPPQGAPGRLQYPNIPAAGFPIDVKR